MGLNLKKTLKAVAAGTYGSELGAIGSAIPAVKHYSMWSDHDVHAAASALRKREQNDATDTQHNLNQVDINYGVTPTGADPEVAAAAASNKTYLDSILGEQRRTALDAGTHDLDNRFASALTANAQRLAATGMAGSSADAEGKRGILSDYLKGGNQLGMAADQADQNAHIAMDDQRLALESQVKTGTAPDLATIDSLGREKNAIGEAYNNLGNQALGNLFAQGANIYQQGQLANAYGLQGTNALRLTSAGGGASRGSIT